MKMNVSSRLIQILMLCFLTMEEERAESREDRLTAYQLAKAVAAAG